jgi:hypothetical protein
MIEPDETHYNFFVTSNCMDVKIATRVVATFDNTEAYRLNNSVRQWVEASKYVIKESYKNGLLSL